MAWTQEEMVMRAAAEINEGDVVNLGIGIPTLVANYIPEDKEVWLHSENGILGMGPFPYEGDEDPKIINAGKQTVTIKKGGSVFDSVMSFSMIRGSHVDLCILGGMEVAQNGDLANWMIPGQKVTGMGGAMDLVSGVKRVVVLMTHQSKKGENKLLAQCNLPLTGLACVHRVITDLGVIDITAEGFRLVECAKDVSVEEIKAKTGAKLITD